MYKDGQIIQKSESTAFANGNNANGNKFYIEPLGDGTYKITEIVIPEPTEYEKAQARIAELKQMLADADYWTSKRMDGEYTEEEWAEKVAFRKAWRAEINQLEATGENNEMAD
jgi:hypothetical protein